MEKENEIWESFETKTSEMREIFQPKIENKTLLKAFKLWIFLQMIVVRNLTLITPIYRKGLGIKE